MNVTTVSELLSTISVSEMQRFGRYVRKELLNQYFLIVPISNVPGEPKPNELVNEAVLFKYLYKEVFLFLVSFLDNNRIKFSSKVLDHKVFDELYIILNESGPCETPKDLYSIILKKDNNYDAQDASKQNIADYFCKKFQYYCFGNENSEIRTLRLTFDSKHLINTPLNIQLKEAGEFSLNLPKRLKAEKVSNNVSNYDRYTSIGNSHTGIVEDIQHTIDNLKDWIDNFNVDVTCNQLKKGHVLVTTAKDSDLTDSYQINSNLKFDKSLGNGRFIYASGNIETMVGSNTVPVNSKNWNSVSINGISNSNKDSLTTVNLENNISHNHNQNNKVKSVVIITPQLAGGENNTMALPERVSDSIAEGNFTAMYLSDEPEMIKENSIVTDTTSIPIYDAESNNKMTNLYKLEQTPHENLPPYYTAKIVVVKQK